MSSIDDGDRLVRNLFRDLGIRSNASPSLTHEYRDDLMGLASTPDATFLRIGFDVAQVVGLSGDWEQSIALLDRLEALGDDRSEIKLWQLRALVELTRYSEAMALAKSIRWPAKSLIHVNYLSALALEAIGARDQSKVKLMAVFKSDASYKDVAQRLSKY